MSLPEVTARAAGAGVFRLAAAAPGTLSAEGPLTFALVRVGALFVGSMATVWQGEVTPRRPRRRADLPLDAGRADLTLGRGAEVGRFNMGSTVILLLPAGRAEWRSTLAPRSTVRVGEALARPTLRQCGLRFSNAPARQIEQA